MHKLILVGLIFICNQTFAQKYIELFKQDIPDNIKSDRVLCNSLDINLERNIALNPELIYFTLNYFQQYDGSKFDTKYFEILKMNERFWFLRRNDWANTTIDKVNATEDHDIIFNTAVPLKSLVVDVKKMDNDKLTELSASEKQLSDFYIVKYYNKNSEMKFDNKTNYSQIRNQIEETKQHYFKEVKADPELLSSPSEIVDNVIDNWYLLLDDKELEGSNLLITCLDDVLLDKGRKKYSVFLGGVFINNTLNFEENLSFPGISHTVKLNKSASLPQLTLGIGYKLFFDKKSYFLSYIDIQAFYSMGYKNVNDKYPVAYTNREVTSTYTIDETVRNFNNDYKLSSLNSYGIKLAVPLYELNFLVIEAAFNFSMNSYVFKPDMHFTYSKYKTNVGPPITRETLSLGAQTLQEEEINKYFSIIPMIDANLKIDSRFGVRISASYNYAAMSIFYNTPLFY